jgi:ribonuclease HI
MPQIEIFTDGACSKNPGPGGWAALITLDDGVEVELTGGDQKTTNNRMELLAVINGLQHLGENLKVPVSVYSDSAYIVNCIRDRWYAKWRVNGWKTSGNKPVENQDLWVRLLELIDKTGAKLIKVKGHSTNSKNNRVDRLAVEAVNKYR